MTTDKIRENRLRRAAERQGLMLQKSRRRDPRAQGFGTYMLVDRETIRSAGEIDSPRGLTIDELERHLRGDDNDEPPS